MRPIMPIGSIVIYGGEERINMWDPSLVPRLWGVKRFSIEDEKAIYPRNTFDSKNSISNFQKMLESEMLKLDSDCVSNAKGSEEHIDINKQTSFEKKYFENTRKEFIYWNNILARMLEVSERELCGR
jgi:hypothetical protein